MPWPTPQDYNEAIQAPALCFEDPELKGCVAEQNALGLPRPVTGAFASVYKVQCGSAWWGVRCFLRQSPERQERYAAISQALAAARLPCMVGFDYLPRGIRVHGDWRPILKMEWVEGPTLDGYIRERLTDPAALHDLAKQWIELTADLRRTGIAHGDLQHGNVLVAGGRLRLIDYDGMYVPALSGRPSPELGHRNYQHPSRDPRHFGSYLDHFSTRVIALSLHAIAAEPALWDSIGAGDEFLLLRGEDFTPASPLLQRLQAHADPEVSRLARDLLAVLPLEPPAIPPLAPLHPAPPLELPSLRSKVSTQRRRRRPATAQASKGPSRSLRLQLAAASLVPGRRSRRTRASRPSSPFAGSPWLPRALCLATVPMEGLALGLGHNPMLLRWESAGAWALVNLLIAWSFFLSSSRIRQARRLRLDSALRSMARSGLGIRDRQLDYRLRGERRLLQAARFRLARYRGSLGSAETAKRDWIHHQTQRWMTPVLAQMEALERERQALRRQLKRESDDRVSRMEERLRALADPAPDVPAPVAAGGAWWQQNPTPVLDGAGRPASHNSRAAVRAPRSLPLAGRLSAPVNAIRRRRVLASIGVEREALRCREERLDRIVERRRRPLERRRDRIQGAASRKAGQISSRFAPAHTRANRLEGWLHRFDATLQAREQRRKLLQQSMREAEDLLTRYRQQRQALTGCTWGAYVRWLAGLQ